MMPWVHWERLALPKALSGWGLKNIFHFSKALAAKVGWRLVSTSSLWTEVVWNKYIALVSLLDWIQNPGWRGRRSYSCIWKAVMASINVIFSRLDWLVGNGQRLQIGLDPWTGSHPSHILSRELCEALES